MKARDAANYLLYIMSDVFDDLTNMKINKLLYFAQGYYLKKYGTPLFDDKIEAWEHGPVVSDVYSLYKDYGDKPIKGYDDTGAAGRVALEAKRVLYDVAKKYGKYTASALRNMTHVVDSPWDKVYRPDLLHRVIPIAVMREYFNKMEELSPEVKKFKETDSIGYRDENGILVLPKEWNDGEI